MNLIKRIWDSKTLEIMADINYEVLKGTGHILKGLASVTYDVIMTMCGQVEESKNKKEMVEDETYEYWRRLSCCEQQEYFKRNYKLQEYGENYRYDNAEQMAKSVAEIARRENRTFTNKYDRY